MTTRETIDALAVVVRSKNAGPYVTTCDIFFADRATFERARAAQVLTPERVANLYRIPAASVLGVYYYEPGLAIKVSFLKTVDAGDVFCADIAGSAQHVPLLAVEVP